MQLYKYITDFFKPQEYSLLPYHIREAEIKDINDIKNLLLEFHPVSHLKDMTVDTHKLVGFIIKSIEDDDHIVLTAYLDGTLIGILIGSVQEFPFFVEKNALELMWYVTPYHRGYIGKDLYHAFAEWCKKKEVSVIHMATPYDNYSLKAFYTAEGYIPVEDVYMLFIYKD